MIRLSLPETEECDTISLSGKGNLIKKILGLLRISGSLILTCWTTLDRVKFSPTLGERWGHHFRISSLH